MPYFLLRAFATLAKTNRSFFSTTLVDTDREIEYATANSIYADLTPQKHDFLSIYIALVHLRFAYFLLQKNTNDSLTVTESVNLITRGILLEGQTQWSDVIEKKAVRHLAPKDNNPSRFKLEVPHIKHLQSVFDAAHSQIDLILLSNQIKHLECLKNTFW